jgi:hypothetical protein
VTLTVNCDPGFAVVISPNEGVLKAGLAVLRQVGQQDGLFVGVGHRQTGAHSVADIFCVIKCSSVRTVHVLWKGRARLAWKKFLSAYSNPKSAVFWLEKIKKSTAKCEVHDSG